MQDKFPLTATLTVSRGNTLPMTKLSDLKSYVLSNLTIVKKF